MKNQLSGNGKALLKIVKIETCGCGCVVVVSSRKSAFSCFLERGAEKEEERALILLAPVGLFVRSDSACRYIKPPKLLPLYHKYPDKNGAIRMGVKCSGRLDEVVSLLGSVMSAQSICLYFFVRIGLFGRWILDTFAKSFMYLI